MLAIPTMLMVLSACLVPGCTKYVIHVTCIKVYNRTVSSNALLDLLNLLVWNFLMMLQILSTLNVLLSFLVQGVVSANVCSCSFCTLLCSLCSDDDGSTEIFSHKLTKVFHSFLCRQWMLPILSFANGPCIFNSISSDSHSLPLH